MGNIILCNGKLSGEPYEMMGGKIKVYSAEEICYVVAKNPDICDIFLRDEGLADFYTNALELPERGMLIGNLIKKGADTSEILRAVLYSSFYFSKYEADELVDKVAARREKTYWENMKMRGDGYLRFECYKEAAEVYDLLLEADIPDIPAEVLGNVFHNRAVTKVHIDGPETAYILFRQAYLCNHSEESLYQYMLSLKYANMNREYINAIKEFEISDRLLGRLNEKFLKNDMEFLVEGESPEFAHIVKLHEDGKINEFYQATIKLVNSMKDEYRKNSVKKQ